MLEKLLVANRGEIACRIFRTARRLGVATAAVYSEADARAMHVEQADEAFLIGPAPAQESYLCIDRIIEAALRAKAQAVHPGYGFLSENPRFAERCVAAGLIFVGPPAAAMRAMGSKAEAKALMARAGAPVVPGYHGAAMDMGALRAAAERIGVPLLIKAASGGGGRGMRLVQRLDEFESAVASAAREALSSFGDSRLLIEKFLPRARHIELQIFADAQGHCVAFPERDCSMQRRHQKILEETPACGLSEAVRRTLRETAVAAAQAVGYLGAGTVEFLVKDESCYFLEMNTRLQVEHPVTEMIAGQDLVEWQLRVACGASLPLTQEALTARGCAMEARICSEDPARGFLPAVGVIEYLRTPCESAAVRVDIGVRRGDQVTQHYDSLLAKLIVWGEDRARALRRLRRALDEFELAGIATNLDFLRALARDEGFARGAYDTEYVERHAEELIARGAPAPEEEIVVTAAGAAIWLAEARRRSLADARETQDPWSPWAVSDGWRFGGCGRSTAEFEVDGRRCPVGLSPLAGGGEGAGRFFRGASDAPERLAFRLDIGEQPLSHIVAAEQEGERLQLWIDGVKRAAAIVKSAGGFIVILSGRNHALVFCDPLGAPAQAEGRGTQLRAPLPARVSRIAARPAERVRKGTPVIVLEAMKMEISLAAPCDGEIDAIYCAEGELVAEDAILASLTPTPQCEPGGSRSTAAPLDRGPPGPQPKGLQFE